MASGYRTGPALIRARPIRGHQERWTTRQNVREAGVTPRNALYRGNHANLVPAGMERLSMRQRDRFAEPFGVAPHEPSSQDPLIGRPFPGGEPSGAGRADRRCAGSPAAARRGGQRRCTRHARLHDRCPLAGLAHRRGGLGPPRDRPAVPLLASAADRPGRPPHRRGRLAGLPAAPCHGEGLTGARGAARRRHPLRSRCRGHGGAHRLRRTGRTADGGGRRHGRAAQRLRHPQQGRRAVACAARAVLPGLVRRAGARSVRGNCGRPRSGSS